MTDLLPPEFPTRRSFLRTGIACLLPAAVTASAASQNANPPPEPCARRAKNKATPKKAAQGARGRRSRVTAPRNNEETRAERDRRMLRECRGKPNAGACEGYAS